MLRLNNNIQAINVNRAMSRNERTTHERMESLSSGLRVSKASIDASGTVISEGFRAQVSGLAQNVRNTEQANDLLRVADGALDVVSDVLVRMRTLAVRSANSDISDEQRSSISAEFNQLRESMNRLAQSTRYNEQILLAGFDAVVEDQSTALSERAVTGVEQVQLTGAVAGTYTFIDSAGDAQITLGDGTVTQTLDMGIILDGDKVGDGTKVKIDFDRLGIQVTLSGLNASGGGAYQTGDLEGKQIKVGQSTGGDFQVGPNDAEADRLALSLPDLRATSNSLNLDKVSINSLETARDAFSPLDKAIQNIASERGKIGAMQNRMGFTLSFSENEIENMTASDSTIRDADVALETSRLTRSQIFAQQLAGDAVFRLFHSAPFAASALGVRMTERVAESGLTHRLNAAVSLAPSPLFEYFVGTSGSEFMSGRLERVVQERAEAVLERVLQFRDNCARYEKPDDVNALLELFSSVHLRAGYVLDYDLVREGEAMTRIRPFARPAHSEESVFSLDEPPDQEGHGEQAVETLYQYLSYDKTPTGIFEYVLFVQELWSTRASWHEAEWLASTPIFTQARFDETVQGARKVEELKTPDSYGPEAVVGSKGGQVRFLVHTPMGWERIYWLEVGVEADGRLDVRAGDIVADLGQGENF